jgi:predicted nucleic acid-binding protein
LTPPASLSNSTSPPSPWPSWPPGHAATDPVERARRLDRLQRAEAAFDPLPFDGAVTRTYGRDYAAASTAGRKARGPRAVDLLVTAIASADDLPL